MIADPASAEDRRRAATEQAVAWLISLQGGGMSAGERGEFVDWLRESPVHIREMLRVSQIDQALKAFNWDGIPTAEQTADNVVRLTGGTTRPPLRRTSFLTASRAIAAGLAVVALAAGGWLALKANGTMVRTQLGEQREMTLADGSIVNIAPLTELRIRYTSDQRSIELRRGHALFRVSTDRRRPFVVDAGAAVVRAVGTSFDVDRTEDAVRVAVVKGRVLVSRGGAASGTGRPHIAAAPHAVQLAANQAVEVPSRALVLHVHKVDGAARAAWVTGTLVFEDETVAEVARRFNLHNVAQLQILDPQLAQRRISGAFKASDPESFVAFIRETNAELARDRPAILLEPHSR